MLSSGTCTISSARGGPERCALTVGGPLSSSYDLRPTARLKERSVLL